MLFNRADKTNRKTLDKQQLGVLLDELQISMAKEELDEMYQRIDRTQRGSIDFVEFCEFVYEAIPSHQRPQLTARKHRRRMSGSVVSSPAVNSGKGPLVAEIGITPVKGIAHYLPSMITGQRSEFPAKGV